MNLADWMEHTGTTRAQLMRSANTSFATIAVALDRKLPNVAAAERISRATGGAVPVVELLAIDEAPEYSPKRASEAP